MMPVPVQAASSVPTVLTKLQKWGDYESQGSPVRPTHFIPMKTPLSEEILAAWAGDKPQHRLTVRSMLAGHTAQGRRVGLIIDLSNHDCLYSADIPAEVSYVHVQLVAKELPPQEVVDRVAVEAHAHWQQHPGDFIALHCAYGFNRTGFIISSYLVEHQGMTVQEAMDAFAEARPPGVKHEKFKAELVRRYSGGEAPQASLLPVDRAQLTLDTSESGWYLGGSVSSSSLATSYAHQDSCSTAGIPSPLASYSNMVGVASYGSMGVLQRYGEPSPGPGGGGSAAAPPAIDVPRQGSCGPRQEGCAELEAGSPFAAASLVTAHDSAAATRLTATATSTLVSQLRLQDREVPENESLELSNGHIMAVLRAGGSVAAAIGQQSHIGKAERAPAGSWPAGGGPGQAAALERPYGQQRQR